MLGVDHNHRNPTAWRLNSGTVAELTAEEETRGSTAVVLQVAMQAVDTVTLNHAIQRLMVLDAIVEDPDLVWLGTAEEKAAHLLALIRIDPADLPHVTVGEGDARTVRYFPDRFPIGIHPAGLGVVLYVVTEPWLDEFRVFRCATPRFSGRCRRGRSGSSCRCISGHRSADQTGDGRSCIRVRLAVLWLWSRR